MSDSNKPAPRDPVVLIGIAVAVVLMMVYTWIAWAGGVHDNWHAALLYPSVGIVQGMPAYYGPTEGPVNNLLYGPLFALFYTPAGLFASPTATILTGMVLSTLSFFAPFFLILVGFGPRADKRDWTLTIIGCVFFFFVVLAVPGLHFSAFRLKPDGPALLFLLLATLRVMTMGEKAPSWGPILATSLLVQLAFWTKQNNVLASAGLAIYLWLVYGRATAVRFVVATGALGLAFLGLWRALYGPPLLFNLVTLASERPLRTNPPMPDLLYWAGSSWNFVIHGLGPFLFLAFLLGIDPELRRGSLRDYVRRNRWTALLFLGMAMAPTAVLGYLAIGGSYNSITNWICPLLAASILLFYRLCGYSISNDGDRLSGAPLSASVGRLALLAVTLALAMSRADPQDMIDALRRSRHLRQNPQEAAFRYVQTHPGNGYFPWTPLAHLMGENRLYHFDYGLSDRRLGKHPISKEHFRLHVPPELEFVAYYDAQDHETLAYFLTDYVRAPPVPELPGWEIYRPRRPSPTRPDRTSSIRREPSSPPR